MTSMHSSDLKEALTAARRALLASRGAHGHWEGALSASALSTAIAVSALSSYSRASPEHGDSHRQEDCRRLSEDGLAWLAKTQNVDGGWGDTVLSVSNISTTAICWAAFAIAAGEQRYRENVAAAERWLTAAAGSLEPGRLATAIAGRYGKDRTFSVPILTTLAIAGRLGEGPNAWRRVPQLPFELAVCPHRWFQWLRLPVVSYALPALIAIGQVRHHRCPTRNPITRIVRDLARRRTLRVLRSIQPTSGGFLEATPLTGFVVLSLVGAGEADCPVTRDGVRFLVRSVRPDGSWPIDTNLATWVTTLSVNALAGAGELDQHLDESARTEITRWLLGQQYCREHPYTHAPPGAWAWTDLSGGVPDADDTPGALLALHRLGPSNPQCRQAAEAGIGWLLDLQNRDGGIPTFCRGWGHFPFDRSSADLTAHAIRAWSVWHAQMPEALQTRLDVAVDRAIGFLTRQQREDGAWVPLWFGNQFSVGEENPTYGTSRVLLAADAMLQRNFRHRTPPIDWEKAISRLLNAQNPDGGWGGDFGTPSSVEETAFAVEALASLLGSVEDAGVRRDKGLAAGGGAAGDPSSHCNPEACFAESSVVLMRVALARGVDWIVQATARGTTFVPAPIGFYFAKLWYYEELYPLIFTVAALGKVAARSPPDLETSAPRPSTD